MSRSVPEWIGKTDDTSAPPRVRLRVFERRGGVCHISGRKIQPGDKWELDHIVALVNGGENRESNLAPALKSAHREKTAQDVKQKAKDRRVRQKHLGIYKPKSRLSSGKWKKKVSGEVVERDDDDILTDWLNP